MDDPEYEENIDMNHTPDIIHQEDEEEIEPESNTYNDQYKIGDLFILITQEGDDIVEDSLVTIQDIKTEENKIFLKDENENDSFIYFDDNKNIILKTNQYEIIDIEKVEEFNLDDIENVELMLTKNIYPEIDLQIVEVKEKIYSLQERKEHLITELISLYDAYNNESLIHQITDIANNFLTMFTQSDDIYDYSNTLPFIKDIIHKKLFNFPSWVIPIVDNKKKLYPDPDDDNEPEILEQDDTTIIDFIQEKIEMKNLFEKYDDFNPNTYRSIMNVNDKYKPYINKQSEYHISIPYKGTYFRNCSSQNLCNGLINQFSVDINKTKNPLIVPIFKDGKTSFETITPEEQLSIIGFYLLPHKLFNFTLNLENNLSLHEIYFLSDFKYSYIPFHKRFLKSEIVPHVMSNDSEKLDQWDNLIHSYLFNDNITLENIGPILQKNFPDFKDIINVIPKFVRESILNYTDLKKVLISYNIDYHDMDRDNRDIINSMIKNNIKKMIRDYNRKIKRKNIVIKEKKQKLLTTDDRIKLSKNYIFSLHVHSLRNFYIKKFINTFSRKPTQNEDKNYFYEKDSDTKLLCVHYNYIISKDKDAFKTMKSIYGEPPNNGIISCKICGEYICHEDFSELEGFSDGVPTISREVIEEQDEINQLNEKQLSIKKHIQKISSVFGITLTKYDIQKIINIYDITDNSDFIDHRYQIENSFNKHPIMQELKEKYKPVKGEKKENKIKKTRLESEAKNFKEYLFDSNELLISTYLVLFFVQTADPPYDLNIKNDLNLWDNLKMNQSWNEIKHTIYENISMTTIDTVSSIFQKMISIRSKDDFWKNCNEFLKESIKYEDLPSFNEHFIMTSSYLLKNSMLKQLLKDHFDIKNNIQQTIYLNEFWPSYKPLYDNSLVNAINQKINSEDKFQLLRNSSGITYENISTILSINEAYITPRYKLLEIPYSDIMNNESYERLFDYSNHLHGKCSSIPIINLLTKQFLNTIPDSEAIEQILETIQWDSFTKEFKSIDYQDFKQIFIIKITDYFKSKNPNDKKTIDTYIHIKLNNWNGMLLNGHPKRNYYYSQPIIYPDESFEEIIETDMINKLFNKFCFTDDDLINERYDNDNFIFNLIAGPTVQREAVCNKNISKTKEHFEQILDFKRNKSKLPFQDITNISIDPEKRILNFTGQYLEKSEFQNEELFSLFNDLSKINDNDDKLKEYTRIFNEILEFKQSFIEKIQQFILDVEDECLDKSQVQRFQNNFGRKINSISIILNKSIDESKSLNNQIKSILFIISRLSKKPNNIDLGTIFHDTIPKQWKLSDSMINHMKDYINHNEFLIHNDIFIPKKKDTYEGFKKYNKEISHSLCFKGLLSYIMKYYSSDIDTIIGSDVSDFNEEYGILFHQLIFLFLFTKIIDYINELRDEQSPASNYANELFLILEEQDSIELKESICICSQFAFDLLIHFLEEIQDTSWIYNTKLLADKLGKQKEREKQAIIDNLESKTSDSRHVTMEHQRAGISNFYVSATQGNQEYMNSDERTQNTVDERINHIKELFSLQENELEVMEANGINTDYLNLQHTLPEDTEIQDEGYDQFDQDREDEGIDPEGADDDGDYREN